MSNELHSLSARDVSVARNGQTLLDAVSIDLNRGERVALIGPNGAGKSTLLKTLTGEIAAEHGSIALFGKPLTQWRDRDAARVRAVLPQATTLNFAFTVREIVELGRFPHCAGALARHDRAIVSEAMNAVEIAAFAEREIMSLSGGERARVHAARVLAQVWDTPNDLSPVLLLDEPTASLDLRHQRVLLHAVSDFVKRRAASVLAVLHDINLTAQWADRIVWLQRGRIVANGSAEQTLQRERIHDVYDVDAEIARHRKSQTPYAMIDMVSN
jgi:iron complex transport system ATP-binding protein